MVTFKEGSSSGANLPFTATYTNKVITLAPVGALTVGSTYYYGIGASVKDASNNVAPATFGSFKMIAPVNPPAIIANTYTINSSESTPVATKLIKVVPSATNHVIVTVTFNDNVKEVVASTPVNLLDGATVIATTNVTSSSVSGNTVTLDFGIASLPALSDGGKELTISLPAGLVQGSTAYSTTAVPPFAQFAGLNIKFDSKDVTAPVVTSANTYDSTTPTPALSTTAVALNTKLELNIGEKVELGSGNIEIREGSATGTLVQSIAVNSTNVTLNTAGTVATVAKADLVKYNTTYVVVVPAGAFKDDISLNPNAAVNFSFVTLPNSLPVVSAFSPADDSDQLSTAGSLTLGLTFNEEVIKYDPSVGSRKQWFLIKNTGTTATPGTRASFGPLLDLVGGTDVVVANNYIETSSVGISGANVTIATGFTPVAGEKYYVLITPGAFLDKSTGTTLGASVVPGVFGGVTLPTTWNFTTANENAGVVTFTYTKRADGKVAKTSDLVINFSRPIKNGSGTAITDSQIATLFTLTKTSGPGTLGTKAFIGTISADKKTVTILNSSLVTLGEMTDLSNYTLALTGSALYENGAAISGASDSFSTSDYTAPVVTPTVANFVSDIVFNATTSKHEATVTFTSTDNSNLAAIYYTIQEGTASTVAPAVSVIKADKTSVVTGTAPAAVTYKFSDLKEETSYVVWAIAVDAAGNESAVNKVVFTTDDKTKPVIATLPTSFDANGKLTFVFNEAVAPVAGSVRILDAATMTYLATLDLVADPSSPSDPKKLVTSAFSGLATGDAIVNYYVEIDKGLVADVPVYTGDAVNYFDGLFRTALMVTSKDITAPTVVSSTPTLPAINVDTNFSIKVTFSEPVRKVSTLPVSAFVVEKVLAGPTYEPFQVVDPANVITNGTKDVTINIGRTLSSTTTYRLTLKVNAFEDLAGNAAAAGTISGLITTKDIVAPAVTFAPAKAATAIALASPITITFAEAIRNLDDSGLDSYDLDSLVYFKKGTTPMAFTASLDASNKIITVVPASALVADASYTYGFKAKFEDFSNNVIAADAATFNTVTTTPAGQYLSWTPVKAVAPATSTWLGTVSPVLLNFTGNIFTYNATVAADSNLPVTPAYLATAISVTKGGVTIAPANLVFTVVDSKTVSVAPKAGTDWGSGSTIVVTLAANKLQIGEGNTYPIPTDASTYNAEDIIDPIVDAAMDTAPFIDGYFPEKVGVNGVSPVVAKTDALKLYFSEDVKVGTGTVEIYRWDGVLAKPAMTASVDATNKKLVTLGDLTGLPTNQEYYVIVNPGAVVDVTDNNTYAGLTAVKTWKFLLKDDAAPQVVSYLPTTTNISVSTKLTVTFDRPIVAVPSGYLALYKSVAGGDAVQLYRGSDVPSKFTVAGNTVTVDISPLEAETTYFVELAAGTFGSAADVTKTQDAILRSAWSFTTEVNRAPLAVTYGPAKADPMTVDVPLTSALTITFDQDVVAGVGNIQLHKKQAFGGPIITNFDVTDPTKVVFSGKTVTISGDVLKLENNSEYYVIIPGTAVKNTSLTPEYWAGITVPFAWQFKTFNDVTAPLLVSYTPNAVTLTTEKNHPTLTMTFNDNLVFGAGNVKIYKKSDNTLALTIPVTAAMVSGKVVTVTYVAPATGGLDKNTDYYVLTDAGIVKDAVGNAVVAITDVTKWTFKTGDFATGIDTPIDNSLEFKVYPNPFVESVTVDNASELTKIVISNIAGQIVKEVVTPDSKIQLNELGSGVYFMSLYQGNTVIKTVKIAKR